MYLANTTREAMEAALAAVNDRYNGNLCLVWLEGEHRRYVRGIGMAYIQAHLHLHRPRGAGSHLIAERRGRNACWHAHRDFFVELIRRSPSLRVKFLGAEDRPMSFINRAGFRNRYFDFPDLFSHRGASRPYQTSCNCPEAFVAAELAQNPACSHPAASFCPSLETISVDPAPHAMRVTTSRLPFPSRTHPSSQPTDKSERLPEDDWS